MTDRTNDTPTLSRYRKPERRPASTLITAGLSGISGLMLGAALPELTQPESFIDWIKCAAMGIAGTLLAYGTNRLAIEKGALQFAQGSATAGAFSVASIVTVGIALGSATYAGFTIDPIDERKTEVFAEKYTRYAEAREAAALKGLQAVPVVAKVRDVLAATTACEFESGCLNRTGMGGTGPVHRAARLEQIKAEGVNDQVVAAAKAVPTELNALADVLEVLATQLNAPDSTTRTGRSAIRGALADVEETLARLDRSLPDALIRSYAAELRTGVEIPARPEASAVFSAILADQAESLEAALPAEIDRADAPTFPMRTGVLETFEWAGYFLPLAMLIFVIEIAFGLGLFLYTFISLRARVDAEDPGEPRDDLDPNSFSSLINMPPAHLRIERRPDARTEGAKRPSRRTTRH
ncbi:MAG: hypothetical protein AAGF33_05370 [Pseudomonadota bacterium]